MLIEHYYISGIYYNNSRNESNFYVYIYLPIDYNIVNEVLDLLTTQLGSMQAAGCPTSPEGMISATATAVTDDPPIDELDDDPIKTNIAIIPSQLSTYPYKNRIPLPTNSSASYGLRLLANRHATRATTILETLLKRHPSTLSTKDPYHIRTNTMLPKPPRDTCSIYSFAFVGLAPTECLRYMRSESQHTLHKLLTADEYRQPHETTTMAAHLSSPTQALLQAMDSIQPVSN